MISGSKPLGFANKMGPRGYLWVNLLPRYQDRSKGAVTPLLLTVNASQVFGATDVDGEEQRGDFRRVNLWVPEIKSSWRSVLYIFQRLTRLARESYPQISPRRQKSKASKSGFPAGYCCERVVIIAID